MNVRRPADPSAFLTATRSLLLEDEARHNLLLGIAGTLKDHPEVYSEHRLWVLEEDGLVVGAALQTPPHNLVIARPLSEDALVALAQTVDDVDVPGVTGAIPEADVFATAWESRTRTTRHQRMAQRIYKLTEVRPPVDIPGRPREATAADRELLVTWARAFAEEATGAGTPGHANPEQIVDSRLAHGAGAFALWEDGEVVSMAGWGGQTPNGVRVGPGYEPVCDSVDKGIDSWRKQKASRARAQQPGCGSSWNEAGYAARAETRKLRCRSSELRSRRQ